jgi:hypothetical protein
VRRKILAIVALAGLATAGFALAQKELTVTVVGPTDTTATTATVSYSANTSVAAFSCSLNSTPADCGSTGTTSGVVTLSDLTTGGQTFVVVATSSVDESATQASGTATWTVTTAPSSSSPTSTSGSTPPPPPPPTSTSTGGGHHHGTSPWWYVLAGAAGGAALVLGAVALRARRTRRGYGVEIEASTQEPKGPCRQKARRRYVKATLLPARRTIATLTLEPDEGETATVAGDLVDALNDAVHRYRNRREADEARLVALPIAAALRREIDERLGREAAGDVAVGAHLEGGKLEVVQRLYGCVEGAWKPVGPEVKVEVADERDEPVATTSRQASAESEQRLVERLAAFIGRVDVTEPTPVEPPRSALRAL